VLSRIPITDFRLHDPAAGPAGRIHELRFCSDEGPARCLAMLALHAARPFGSESFQNREAQIRAAAERAAMIAGEGDIQGRVLLLGDFNLPPWSRLYREALETGGLKDVMAGGLPHSTWFSTFGAAGLPIDHIWAGPAIKVTSTEIGPLSGSDHLPVHAAFALDISLRPGS